MQCHASARLVPRMMVCMGSDGDARATLEQGRRNPGAVLFMLRAQRRVIGNAHARWSTRLRAPCRQDTWSASRRRRAPLHCTALYGLCLPRSAPNSAACTDAE